MLHPCVKEGRERKEPAIPSMFGGEKETTPLLQKEKVAARGGESRPLPTAVKKKRKKGVYFYFRQKKKKGREKRGCKKEARSPLLPS